MSITTELEKLSSLKDRGDLSESEFEKAKALVLSGEKPADALAKRDKDRKTQFLIAFFATLGALFSGGSLILDPSLFTAGVLIFWLGLSTAGWMSYSKAKSEARNAGHTNPPTG